ncbi:hypothetical protein TH66_13490 [Carbonactinospora thermoautotrophica]|uniref:Uncharacterized protein n=1 Tax=Carbonactinospora thermoautotrophica TaxID=1469144 RepID=A0A132NL67_9ACTN|nr:hypothetical protein [Carbonactinospora thermoautotrophica]KWX02752.1 hypothetical protein LI90_3798 [Carbonactinospora thermoautotrophica]KWX03793.1 hypothetical protein TH66_13490 [Carbonactinospora thermoautotrophica]KWX10472.1 hypothetical protein TR74_03385 [Carbonactinospora thermoautotrophica]
MYDPTAGCPRCGAFSDHTPDCTYLAEQRVRAALDALTEAPNSETAELIDAVNDLLTLLG